MAKTPPTVVCWANDDSKTELANTPGAFDADCSSDDEDGPDGDGAKEEGGDDAKEEGDAPDGDDAKEPEGDEAKEPDGDGAKGGPDADGAKMGPKCCMGIRTIEWPEGEDDGLWKAMWAGATGMPAKDAENYNDGNPVADA